MRIDTFILVNNEEKIIEYVMRHYSQFSHVVILDNNSSDQTIPIAKKMGAEIWKYNVPDEMNDKVNMDIKNNCWKRSSADWCIVIDADEFVYHPDLIGFLEKTSATIIAPTWCEMYAEKFPTTKKQIYDEVKTGTVGHCHGHSKINLLRPSQIREMNWDAGCHNAKPIGNVIPLLECEIKTLHMRWLSKEYVIARSEYTARRMSMINKKMGWSFHFAFEPEKLSAIFDEDMKKVTKIL